MSEPGEESDEDPRAGPAGSGAAPVTGFPPGDLEAVSIYDSLLRGVAAGTPSIHIDAEVGPHGKFVLQQEIGSGAMGRVFRALDRYLLRDVAIKFILRPEGMNHDDFMALFWQEARIIARLDQHDNIVRIFDVDRSSYPPFIVMEYLDGHSLEKLLVRGPIDAATALHVMIGVACGLREAHAKDIFHRDLKPSNIFLQKTGRVKLLDFGLARIRNHLYDASTTKLRLVTVHSVPPLASAGTPAYMAPEQWRGEEADASTDLWAMGTILYRLLGNVPPFDGETLAALSARVLSGEPPQALAERCPELPGELCQLVDRLLRVERSERPSTASEVIAVLDSAVRAVSSPGYSAGAAPPARSPPRPFEPWSAGGPDHRFALGSEPDSALRLWGRILLVLVPGTDSSADPFSEHLGGWILHNAGVNFEVLRYPPSPPGDLGGSALRLGAALNERFRRPRHIVFVTHGDGTAVVVRMLLDEARRLRSQPGDKLELDVRSPFYRARHVAVMRAATPAYEVDGLGAPLAPAPLVPELVSEADAFRTVSLPAPTIHYFGFDDDRSLQFNSSVVKSIAAFLVRPELLVARETIAQTFELDCAAKIWSLVGPGDGGDTDRVYPTVPGADGVTQLEVYDELLALARVRQQRPFTIVVAGDTGVGKSTVLRRAARSLCNEFLASPADDNALPILIPLYFASLTSDHLAALGAEAAQERRGRVLHDILLDWWCNWFNDITYAGALDSEWVRARLRLEAVMLVFDGVDEFIANHPALGISDFQQLVGFLGAEYRQNGRLAIVLGVRSTQPGLPSLAASNIREILRLTTAQAMRQFPATTSLLSTDAPIKALLFTPLILAQLNTRRPPSAPKPSTHGDVLLLALTTIIERSDLCGKLDESGRPIEAQRWIDALTAVAWCLFRRLRGEVATGTLKLDGGELHRAWAEHLERTQQQAEGEQLMSGFHLLCEARACDALLHRTILYPTGRGEVRFIHREWQDFLAARYLAQVVMYRCVDEFRHVGNTARISQMAGELLCQADVCIDEAFVVALLQRAHDTGARLITANFAALLTNSRVLIEGPAIDTFLSAVDTMPAVARFITLIGLGYRALRGDDASAQDLRHGLMRVFQSYLSRPVAGDDLGVMRSVAWCYQKAFARRFGGPSPSEDWPGLHDDDEPGALAMMSSTADGRPRVLVEHRSIQMALLEVQQAVPDDPFRPISGAHYLYCLTVTRRHGAGIMELGREMPALLAPGSRYAMAIENDPLVPELRDVLAACRRIALAP